VMWTGFKNAIFRDVTPCGSCKNQRSRGTYRLHLQGKKNERAEITLTVTSNCVTEDGILHNHRRVNLKSYTDWIGLDQDWDRWRALTLGLSKVLSIYRVATQLVASRVALGWMESQFHQQNLMMASCSCQNLAETPL
jgi:hypothetical protein